MYIRVCVFWYHCLGFLPLLSPSFRSLPTLYIFCVPANNLLSSLTISSSSQIKYVLLHLYGSEEGYELEEMTPIHLARKEELCQEVMKVADIIQPGKCGTGDG